VPKNRDQEIGLNGSVKKTESLPYSLCVTIVCIKESKRLGATVAAECAV